MVFLFEVFQRKTYKNVVFVRKLTWYPFPAFFEEKGIKGAENLPGIPSLRDRLENCPFYSLFF